MKKLTVLLILSILASLIGCNGNDSIPEQEMTNTEDKSALVGTVDIITELGLTKDEKEATETTVEINSAVYSMLDFENTQEWEYATKGLIAAPEALELKNEDGKVIWSQDAYAFVDGHEQAPDTVNPSLWENTKNNRVYGLFEVVDGIYQVRGYDMSNLTLVEGDTGWIILDTLMSKECAQAAMQLVNEHLGERPVKAVIISHSHVDHFGGIKGIISQEEVADASLSIEEQIASGKVPIIVPEGFAEHAVSENVYAGVAMSRRATYQYGVTVEPGIYGRMAMGIGMGQSLGLVTYLAPSYEVTKTGEIITIDGVKMEFQMTPGTEAPSEMNTWFPQWNGLWMAENCTGTLHNLYTLRGAQVRDGAAWANYISETVVRYGKDVEVVFQSHNWPHWGNELVNDYLTNTAAVYKYINDQTLTYLNQGYTSDEISNMIQLPDDLAQNWYTRQYYGTVAHNSKAVYQKYMGWYDGNPVNLNPLTPSDSAKKWVEYLGDTDEVLRMAKEDYEAGEYQWVAEITNVLVYADPANEAARLLCADALEQLGYQAESGTWRNAYLSAAEELRYGNQAADNTVAEAGGDVVMNMTADMIFDYLGIMLDKKAMEEYDFKVNITVSDLQKQYVLEIKSGVLLMYEDMVAEDAAVTITCPKNALLLILQNNSEGLAKAAKIEGDAELLQVLMSNMNQCKRVIYGGFNIVEP